MENITFQYPAWYLLFCVVLGLAYSLTLYFRDKTFAEQYPNLHKILGAIRFLSATFLAVLLLQPLLKSLITETKKPVVVLAQDQSESISAALGEEDLTAYRQNWEAMRGQLSEKYEVKEYAFGSQVREGIDFEMGDKVSNISAAVAQISDLYSGQNLGAVVLATDGIYNEGSNPLYAGSKLNVPVYAVALGDTVQKKDLVLKRVFHNKIAYLGDKFSVQVDVAANHAGGSSSVLTVAKVMASGKTRKLKDIPISINRDDFFATHEIILDADASGVQRYRISLSPIEGEVTRGNNVKEFYVDILDARQKLLLVANSPRPYISALKQTL